jgi:arabinogalactan oligomer/maltooligosaccharide transport system substrate-binding protein
VPAMDAVWADWGATEVAIINGQGDPVTLWQAMVASIEGKIAG